MPSPRTDGLELPDVNTLVALLHPSHVHHQTAHEWFAGVARFATTPITESGFLRLTLNPAVAGEQIEPAVALASLQSLRSHQRAEFLADDASFADPAIDLIGLAGYRQVTDFHLANLASRHHAILVTFDRRLRDTLVAGDRDCVRVLG